MRALALACPVLAAALLFHVSAGAQMEMPQSVLASGGSPLCGQVYRVSGSTLGQGAIGFMGGPGYIHHAGFWYPGLLLTPVEGPPRFLAADTWLGQNYPNPFNPLTTIGFSVRDRSRVTIKVYDVNGRAVMTVADEEMDPGRYVRVLDAKGLASGIYFYRMTTPGFIQTRKLVLLK